MDIYKDSKARSIETTLCSPAQCRIYSVSPLNNLCYETVKLKQYSSNIKQNLTNIAGTFDVIIETAPFLKTKPDDPVPLLVLVSRVTQTNDETAKSLLYEGVLLSWGKWKDVSNAVHLPFYLERGDKSVAYIVKLALNKLFDCTIVLFTYSQVNVLYLCMSFVQRYHEDTSHFVMSFSNDPQQHMMAINFNTDDVYKVLVSCKDAEPDPVTATFRILQNQIFLSFQVDMAAMTIMEINFSKAQVKCNGVVKMKSLPTAITIFETLNSLAEINNLV